MAAYLNGIVRLRGAGESTGTKYEFINAIQNPFTTSLVNGQASETFVGQSAIISQGPAGDWFLTPVFHLTVNANGEVAVSVEKGEEVCR